MRLYTRGRAGQSTGFALLALAFLVGLISQGLSSPAAAQRLLPNDRPGDERPTLPEFDSPEEKESLPILPPFPIPTEDGSDAVNSGEQIEITRVEIEGNTVLDPELLQNLAVHYQGRSLSYSDLQALRDQITLAYVERGYVTSGAQLPDQFLSDGVLRIVVVEGRIDDIEVQIDGRLRPAYFQSRLRRAVGEVVNVNDLQHALELFQKDPQIVQIQAYLEPTSMRGVSALRVVVKEAPFYDVSGDFDNHRSPSIGSSGGSISVGTHNLIGFGDDWTSRFSGSEGLRQIEAGFSIPVSLWDTRFKARYQYSEGEVVDDDFKALDIESESEEVGFALTQPLYRGERLDVRATIRADWRRAQSFLFGGAIGLPTAYDDEGKSKVSVLRLGFDASYRSQNQSVVLRSLVSRGFDVLGATSNPGSGQASGEFWAWLGQIQWASRLPWWNAQLLTRFETQLASDPLLPLEQFAIGGRYTVRGYRENTLVQDNGLVGSIELRLPVYRQFSPEILFELVPFIDVGRSWNESRSTALASDQRQTIASVGIGGRWTVSRWGFAELYWGHQLDKVDLLNDSDLQDDGVSFRVGLSWP